jgi:predicted transcriptional regulator YdeE
MEKYTISKNIEVFGIQVKTFPEGITGIFNQLMNKIIDGHNRDYYGISYMKDDGKIYYFAAAAEKEKGEAEKYKLESCKIEKGNYLIEAITEWKQKLHTINSVFHELMKEKNIDKTKPCVEWYKSETEMWCMIKTRSNQLYLS